MASKIPLDRLLIETDAPYLTPVPFRGKRNEPAFVAITAEEIARLRGLKTEDLAKACTENGRKLFRIA
ncbi:MAG: putative deoxyribonuclease YcfH [Firmicutes bacterium ADurb.Bin456]|nr:MAG: putative deoxyribonuclease YcfH [Firmicutes bacterium ADurb.Bin456]